VTKEALLHFNHSRQLSNVSTRYESIHSEYKPPVYSNS